jgi:hypothetical protein
MKYEIGVKRWCLEPNEEEEEDFYMSQSANKRR